MKTTLQQIANVYSGVAGDRRVLVALFEYVKPDGTALAAEEIETILDAANGAASELGAEICWQATNGEIATPTLADDERVALELVATAVKISPDPIPEVDENVALDEEIAIAENANAGQTEIDQTENANAEQTEIDQTENANAGQTEIDQAENANAEQTGTDASVAA